MRLDRMEALEIEQRVDEAVRSRIAIDGRHDVIPKSVADRWIVFERVRVSLANQFARHIRMIEPFGDAMHDRLLECVVMQNRGIDEAGKLRLAPRHLLGFVANALPDRINIVEPLRFELLLSHACLRRDASAVYHRWGRDLSPSR